MPEDATQTGGTPSTEGTPSQTGGQESQAGAADQGEGAQSKGQEPKLDDALARLEALEKSLKETRKEAASYRQRAKEAEEAAKGKQTAEERLASLEEKMSQREHDLVLERAKSTLMPVLGNDSKRVGAAVALAEKEGLIGEDGTLDVEKFKETFDFLIPQAETPAGAPAGNPPRRGASGINARNIGSMSPEDYESKRSEIFAALKEGRVLPE